jgi:WD40 repeat protein
MADNADGESEFDVPDLTAVASYQLEEAVICLDISRDGALLAAGSVDEFIVVLDSKELRLLAKLDGHEGGTNSLAFGAQRLVSAGEDGKAKLWNAKEGSCVAELACEGVDADR